MARLDPAQAAAYLIAARRDIGEQRVRLGYAPPPPPPCESRPTGVPALESSLTSSRPGSLPGAFPGEVREAFLETDVSRDREHW